MDLGAFSLSLTVKDISVSLEFYQRLGFTILDGSIEQKWLMLSNATTKIGLFEGMFDDNILTFHPKELTAIQNTFKQHNMILDIQSSHHPDGSATHYAMLTDPDGNRILLDQTSE